MLRVIVLLWVSIAMQGAAIAEDAKQDTVQVHGKSLVLSCAEWKRNEDGSWTSVGPLLVGTSLVPVHKRQAIEIIWGIVDLADAKPGGFE